MRVVDKETFMKLPRYTVYSKSDGVTEPLVGEICVKGGNFGKKDFYYTALTTFNIPVKSEDDAPVEKMRANMTVSYPGMLVEVRDNKPNEDCKFIIYDRHEIKQMMCLLEKAIKKLDKVEEDG